LSTALTSALDLRLQGFDEFMNVVLDDAEEVYVKTHTRKALGRILLKGDNITLIAPRPSAAVAIAAAPEVAAAGTGAMEAEPA